MGAFFAGILAKWGVYIICIVLGTGVVTGGYYLWKHGVETEAQLQFDNEQLKKTLADQQKYIDDTKAINDAQSSALNALSAQNVALSKNLQDLDTYLSAASTLKDDRPASVILKNTITKLKAMKQ